jgi:hypothetical protein
MRKLAALLAAVILGCGLTLATSSSASATDASLGCRIVPGTITSWGPFCYNTVTASWYNVGFLVQNAPTPLSYTWSIPSGHSIYADCGSTDNSCGVVAYAPDYFTVTLTLNYSDHSQSYSATASLETCPYC